MNVGHRGCLSAPAASAAAASRKQIGQGNPIRDIYDVVIPVSDKSARSRCTVINECGIGRAGSAALAKSFYCSMFASVRLEVVHTEIYHNQESRSGKDDDGVRGDLERRESFGDRQRKRNGRSSSGPSPDVSIRAACPGTILASTIQRTSRLGIVPPVPGCGSPATFLASGWRFPLRWPVDYHPPLACSGYSERELGASLFD
ncbi:hypothetical protein HPB51_025115 [Rhipicephalus microplus]|uniref:Uncharacterized protein n=1 Tax=Rhipicephalus microplus TaxID=6941 RepID=A0A9J6DRK0_RHIMP|nr:hypothetical protein HPB51_025115 [Rhipicephalus microplus]